MDPQARHPQLRRDRRDRARRGVGRRAQHPADRRRAADPARARPARRAAARDPGDRRHRAFDQRSAAGRPGGASARGGLGARQRLTRHARRGTLPHDRPASGARARAGRDRRRNRRGPRSGEDQLRADARHQRRRAGSVRRTDAHARRARPVHRSDAGARKRHAAGSGLDLFRRGAGPAARTRRPASGRERARQRAGTHVRLRGSPRHDRCDLTARARLLRALQPRPALSRRAPQALPVRRSPDRLAHAVAGR